MGKKTRRNTQTKMSKHTGRKTQGEQRNTRNQEKTLRKIQQRNVIGFSCISDVCENC